MAAMGGEPTIGGPASNDPSAPILDLRALAPERGGLTPAACLTGTTGPEDRARVLGAGFQYHIAKPVSMPRLLGVVAILALKP